MLVQMIISKPINRF